MLSRVVLAAPLLIAAACGGTAIVDPDDDGSSSTGTGATTGTSAGTTTGTSTGTTTGASTGTATGTGAGAGLLCGDLQATYLVLVAEARSCNPFIDLEECTLIVPEELPCPCGGTAVNPGNAEVLDKLLAIADEWFAMGCADDIACPDIECEPATGGSCQPAPDGMSGICETLF